RPCYVQFSGGCDSSIVLAAAADACRRAGHADPIAVSYRFATPTADDPFQREVLDHLRLAEWVRLPIDDADVIGAAATPALRANGVVWPATFWPTAGRMAS